MHCTTHDLQYMGWSQQNASEFQMYPLSEQFNRLTMTDDHTTTDNVVLPFHNISDGDFYSIKTDVINKELHRCN